MNTKMHCKLLHPAATNVNIILISTHTCNNFLQSLHLVLLLLSRCIFRVYTPNASSPSNRCRVSSWHHFKLLRLTYLPPICFLLLVCVFSEYKLIKEKYALKSIKKKIPQLHHGHCHFIHPQTRLMHSV